MNIKIISAGAGSGKTYRLTSEMVDLLKQGVRPSGIIATTFTTKAAAELQERVRVRLLENGMSREADELTNALIGTVHGLGVKLLRRFSYEAGVSPHVDIIADDDNQLLFNQSLATVLTEERVETMDRLSDRLGLKMNETYDWRQEVRRLTDIARTNGFSMKKLEKSRHRSFETFQAFLGPVSQEMPEQYNRQLQEHLEETITRLNNNEDETKITKTAIGVLKELRSELRLRGELYWSQWAKLSKLKVGAKSRDDIAELQAFASTHDTFPAFHRDIRNFIDQIFGIAIAAIQEYQQYKKRRGLIDYTDMEVLIRDLLRHPEVQPVLEEELDLLLVDEFQDTSPIQLEIFLKLSRFARYSIWVGDPKQSIYGFRGADPSLMQAITAQSGGIRPQDIQIYSWRSREDIVYATNALFTKAFPQFPAEQVALQPKRTKLAQPGSQNRENEPIEVDDALIHWHFHFEEGNRQPGKPWMENCIAESLRQFLEKGVYILPKGEKTFRKARAGDVAILCRSNSDCRIIAEALHRTGLKASISRSGLLATAESRLILACLKYILHQQDSLSVAEILMLAGQQELESIIEDRLNYLADPPAYRPWGSGHPFILRLDELRPQVVELSGAELLNLLLEELDLRRIIAAWGNVSQRLDNVDVLRKMALQYEEACNRLHTAASLGGFLLWLSDLENRKADMQGSGESPDSVNVLTYHKSKGLEWPVVICHSLDQNLRAEVWGIDVVPETPEVDLNDILGNRWLRYWVNPYGDQFRNTPLEERIDESKAKAEKVRQDLQEEARLLYVGITRARDYLILPSGSRPTKWLNRVWHEGNEDYPTLDPDTYESPWEWNGQFLNIQTETFLYPKDFTYADPVEESVSFIEPPSGKHPYVPYAFDLNREKLAGEYSAQTGTTVWYGGTFPMKDDADPYTAAKVIKAFLTACHDDYPAEEIREIAEGLVTCYDMPGQLDPKELIRRGKQWEQYLKKHFTIRQRFRKYPVRYFYQDRLFETVLDLVLETDHGLVLIQNSGFAGEAKKWRNKALELADWFFLSRKALAAVFDVFPIQTYLHFVLGGSMVEVEIQERGKVETGC